VRATVLLVVSVGLFWRRFGRVPATIRQAKPDAEWRLRDFIRQVLLQGNVIRERTWPGLAWRMLCILGILRVRPWWTMDHWAAGFGFPLTSRSGAFGRIYFTVAVRLRGLRGSEHRVDLPALRAADFHGLKGLRQRSADRASQ
jgi:hypothetical protein